MNRQREAYPVESGFGSAEPVFREPWEAQVFAMAVGLAEAGVFSWPEWTQTLVAEIRGGAASDTGGAVSYRTWLDALETLLIVKGIADRDTLNGVREAWDHAACSTPHGQPIRLDPVRAGIQDAMDGGGTRILGAIPRSH